MAVIIAYHQGACYVEGEKKNERQKKKMSYSGKKMMLLLFMFHFIRVFYELRCGEENQCSLCI